jgi:hypothetical protein
MVMHILIAIMRLLDKGYVSLKTYTGQSSHHVLSTDLIVLQVSE